MCTYSYVGEGVGMGVGVGVGVGLGGVRVFRCMRCAWELFQTCWYGCSSKSSEQKVIL